jgi:DNA repair exonuclease SbcCD ATPase subunit
MKNIRIKNLTVRNFKGLKAFDLPLDGTNTAIHGTNATGKTTLFDAVSWLLFDKDSLNSSQFEIKPLKDGEPVHNLETSVEAVFEIEDE